MRRYITAIASAIILALTVSHPASAQAIDPATATCGQLTSTLGAGENSQATKESKSRIGVLLIWMAGFLAPESQGSVVDFQQIHSDLEKITAGCMQTPTLGIKTVATPFWGKAQATTASSIDISTLTCNTIQSERSAAATLWLVGSYASDEDTPMFDMDEIGKTMEKIAAVCAKSPSMSIATAAEKVLE